MKKKIQRVVKIQAQAGKATPAPPLGPALGTTGINIGEFCSKFNDATKDRAGEIVPAVLTVYEDRTYDFILKTAPSSYLIRKAAGIDKGSSKNLIKKAGTITKDQIKEIAEIKKEDLNAADIESASKIIEGTARSMGVTVSE